MISAKKVQPDSEIRFVPARSEPEMGEGCRVVVDAIVLLVVSVSASGGVVAMAKDGKDNMGHGYEILWPRIGRRRPRRSSPVFAVARPDGGHPYAEPHRAGAQVATDRQVANRAPDLSGTPEKKGVGPT